MNKQKFQIGPRPAVPTKDSKVNMQGLLVQEPGSRRKVLCNIAVAQASTVKHKVESLTPYHLL